MYVPIVDVVVERGALDGDGEVGDGAGFVVAAGGQVDDLNGAEDGAVLSDAA